MAHHGRFWRFLDEDDIGEMIRRNAGLVDETNATMLHRLSVLAFLITLLLVIFALTVPDWYGMLSAYIIFAVLELVLFALTGREWRHRTPGVLTVSVYLLFAMLFGIFIYQQLVAPLEGPVLSFTVLMFVLPSVYIDRPARMNTFLALACLVMVVATLNSPVDPGIMVSAADGAADEIIVTLFAMVTGTIVCYARVGAIDARNSLHEVLSNSPMGISVFRTSGDGLKVVYLSEAVATFFDMDIEELTRKLDESIFARVHPDDVDALFAAVDEASHSAGLYEGDFRAVKPDDSCRWVHFRLKSVEERRGVYTLYIAYADVDKQKTADLELAVRYEAEQSYLESLSDAYLLTLRANLEEDRIEKSSGILPMLLPAGAGYSAAVDLLASRAPRTVDRDALVAALSRDALLGAASEGRTSVVFEHYSTRDEGDPLWIRTTAKLIRLPASEGIIAFVYMADITSAKIRDIMLSHVVEEQFDFIVYVSGAQRTLTLIAGGADSSDMPAQDVALGYDEVLAGAMSRVVPEQRERIWEALRLDNVLAKLEEDDTFSETFSIAHADTGDIRFKKVQYFLLDRTNRAIGLIRSDYTETYAAQLEQEQTLRRALSDARDANRAKSEFLSRMSHDIRTPLNGVIGMTALALQGDNPPETTGYLEKIDYSSHLLLSLVNDILDVSRVESGRMELRPEPYSNQEFFRSIDATIRPLCDVKHIVFSLYTADSVRTVLVDPLRFDQIFYNLLANAVKFTPEGGHVSLDLEAVREADGTLSADFVVRDDGIGMGPDFLGHLFEPFAQEHVALSDGRHGTGLGLTIVKSLVELMGGTITVKSERGVGSEFRVHLALPIVDTPVESRSERAARTPDLHGRRMLVAEDNAINAEIIGTILRRGGAEVEAVPDGARALDAVSSAPEGTYDAVLMDIRMPVMDGLEATRRIRKLPQGRREVLPIIAMTANAFEEDVRACLEAGMDAHVAKPLDPGQVAATLLSLIDAPRPDGGGTDAI